jgi:hypothetical protein
MKSETEAADDDRAICRGREQVGRNTQVGRNPPSSDSEIRCVSREVVEGSQSGAYRLITIRAIGRTVSPYRSGAYRLITIRAIGRTVSPYRSGAYRLIAKRAIGRTVSPYRPALIDSLPCALLAGRIALPVMSETTPDIG